jgi:hypothetical protein
MQSALVRRNRPRPGSRNSCGSYSQPVPDENFAEVAPGGPAAADAALDFDFEVGVLELRGFGYIVEGRGEAAGQRAQQQLFGSPCPCKPPSSAASEKWIVLGEDSHLASPVRPEVHQAETR